VRLSADNIADRSSNINDYFTYSLYCNVCRSLFEKHKLLFAVLLAARILQSDGSINMVRYGLSVKTGWLILRLQGAPEKNKTTRQFDRRMSNGMAASVA